MMSGRFAKGLPCKSGNIDLLLVGEIVLPQVASIIKQLEGQNKKRNKLYGDEW